MNRNQRQERESGKKDLDGIYDFAQALQTLLRFVVDAESEDEIEVEVIRLSGKHMLVVHAGSQRSYITGRDGRLINSLREIMISASGAFGEMIHIEISSS